mgnify:CR=1 FL=1
MYNQIFFSGNFVFTVLPERYEKVLTMYETMKDEGYILTLIKINPAKEEINALFETIKQAFYELRYMEVKEEIKTLTYKINDIDVLLSDFLTYNIIDEQVAKLLKVATSDNVLKLDRDVKDEVRDRIFKNMLLKKE